MNRRTIEELKAIVAQGGPDVPSALKELGSRYWNGTGTPKDEAAAHHWWLKASEAGNAAAMVLLHAFCVLRASMRSLMLHRSTLRTSIVMEKAPLRTLLRYA